MQDREVEKAVAVAEVERVLYAMMDGGKVPDTWERMCLVHAIQDIFSGRYGLAVLEARDAETPIDRRRSATLPIDSFLHRCDLPLLSRALNAAKAEPVREFEQLGPIELK